MALIVRVGVLTPVSLAKFPSCPSYHSHLIIPRITIGSFIPHLSPVTIPQVVAATENVFSVNLPGKIRVTYCLHEILSDL